MFLASQAMGNSGYVLCLSDTGHIKIESDCRPDKEFIAETAVLECAPGVHKYHVGCDDCTDVPLRFDSHAHRPTIQNADTGVFIPYILPQVIFPVECTFTTVRPASLQNVSPLFTSMATLSVTVLLC